MSGFNESKASVSASHTREGREHFSDSLAQNNTSKTISDTDKQAQPLQIKTTVKNKPVNTTVGQSPHSNPAFPIKVTVQAKLVPTLDLIWSAVQLKR